MTRLVLFALVPLALAGCRPTNLEISCGSSVCASNQRCEAVQQICVLDEPPTLKIDSPAKNALVAGETLSLRGSVDDDSAGSTLELSTDGAQTWTRIPLVGSRFDAIVPLPVSDSAPLSLELRAHDSHQQAATASVTVIVDNVAPQLTVIAPLPDAKLNGAWFTHAASVDGLAIDGSGDATVTLDVGQGPSSVPVSGGQFFSPWAAPTGEDGVAHTLKLTATDAAGNQTVFEETVTVDVVPPTIGFVAPAADAVLGSAFFSNGGMVAGSVSPGAAVEVALGGPARAATVNGTQWSVTWPAPVGVDFQPQQLEVTATDEAGNTAQAQQRVTVDVVPPVLTFSSPAAGAKLNAAAFSNTDLVPVAYAVSDGDAQVVVRNGTTVVSASPLNLVTSPTDNPKGYSVSLTAEDRAGNSTSTTLAFAVDRVLPTLLARVPTDGSRNNASVASVDFSEPVSGADGLSLVPAVAGGSWTTPTHFEVAGLAADSVFVASVGAVVDGFGNPLAPSPTARFHTSPALPVSGATLMADVGHFKAAVDRDGVLSVFTTSTTILAGYRWARVNPKSGQIEDNFSWPPTVGSAFSELSVTAWSRANPDLTARRISGAQTLHVGTIDERKVWTRFDDGVVSNDLGMAALIPTPAFVGETGTGEVGELKYVAPGSASYFRAGMTADLDVGLGAPLTVGLSDKRWELAEVRNQTFKRRTYACVRHFANGPITCELSVVQQWSDVSTTDNASYAMSDACSIAVYDTSSGSRVIHIEPWVATCLGSCPSGTSATQPLGTELRVAVDRRESNTFLSAERGPNGIQLKRFAPNSTCVGTWVAYGAPVAVPLGAAFEPISLGGKPALLYVDTGNLLKVVLP